MSGVIPYTILKDITSYLIMEQVENQISEGKFHQNTNFIGRAKDA